MLQDTGGRNTDTTFMEFTVPKVEQISGEKKKYSTSKAYKWVVTKAINENMGSNERILQWAWGCLVCVTEESHSAESIPRVRPKG